MGSAILQMETKQTATPARRLRLLAREDREPIERYVDGVKGTERRSARGIPAFGKRNKAPGGLVVVGGA
jgi:hypothetical protein